ncbi:ABC transporter permease subunit [Peptoniphilus stercorisuis]|uniref:ABC-2 type transport system permease protein n=1 Tax=Peptoniphilus stercorisuis TaxID=1436965 RepID=A0ABS4KCI9_9FIRM|nr:ABC transporter permease subunit [Peptoniphilus stercorisuis]MBP2025480.1 ABC-2 type transport system permease protein [Peptoniphilus stercorisuis]
MVFEMEFKSTFGKMIAWILVLLVLVGLLLALYPMMLDLNMKSMFDSFISSLSTSFKSGLGLEEKIDYTNMGQYIAFIYQYIAVLIAMFAMQIGANSLAREQSLGNIEYIYSNPISRSEIVTQKLLSSVLTYIIFLVVLAVATFGLAVVLTPKDADIRKQQIVIDLIKIFVGLLASGFVYMSIGYFVSSLSKTINYTEGISVLFVLINIILIIFGKINGGTLKNIINNFSLEVFKPIKMLTGTFSIVGILINLVVFVIFILLTYLVYDKKELKF